MRMRMRKGLEEFGGLADEFAVDDGGLVLPRDDIGDGFLVLSGEVDVDFAGFAGDDLGLEAGFAQVDVDLRAVVDLQGGDEADTMHLDSEAVEQLDHRNHRLPIPRRLTVQMIFTLVQRSKKMFRTLP